jgi:hypothetical protein
MNQDMSTSSRYDNYVLIFPSVNIFIYSLHSIHSEQKIYQGFRFQKEVREPVEVIHSIIVIPGEV